MSYVATNGRPLRAKEGDTVTFNFQLQNYLRQPVNITGTTVRVVIADKSSMLLNKQATIVNAGSGLISFSIGEGEFLPKGNYDVEFVVTYPNLTEETFPTKNHLGFKVEQSLENLEDNIQVRSALSVLLSELNTAKNDAEEAIAEMNVILPTVELKITEIDNKLLEIDGSLTGIDQATQDAINAAVSANQAATSANNSALTANQAAEDADLAATNANQKASEADLAAQTAETAANNADSAVLDLQDSLAQNVHRGEYNASTQYYKNNSVRVGRDTYKAIQNTLGNHPTNQTFWQLEAQGGIDGADGVDGVDGTGSVSSVNGQSPDGAGNVLLDAGDVGASPVGHGHEITDVNGLNTALSGKSPVGHSHSLNDLTDVDTSTTPPQNGQILKYNDGTWSPAEDGGSGGVTGVFSVNGETGDVLLDHNDVGAAPASHGHEMSEVTGLETALNGKMGKIYFGVDMPTDFSVIWAKSIPEGFELYIYDEIAMDWVLAGESPYTATTKADLVHYHATSEIGGYGAVRDIWIDTSTPPSIDMLWLQRINQGPTIVGYNFMAYGSGQWRPIGESTAGAQAKANTAEANAKAYAKNKISLGGNLDPDTTNESLIWTNVNTPDANSWIVETNFTIGLTSRFQTATRSFGSQTLVYKRSKGGSIVPWTSWTRITDEADVTGGGGTGDSVFTSITSNGVTAGSTDDQSAGIQAILTANKMVYFPAGEFTCFNLRPQQGSVIMFHPDCVLKFPTAAATTGGGNRQMFLIGFVSDVTEGNEFDGFRTIGHPTIDASVATASGTELEGFHILGAKNVHIDGCTGLNFINGYVVWAGAPYTELEANVPTLAMNDNITIRDINSINSGWGAVAVTAGRNFLIENIYAEGAIYPEGGGFYSPAAVCIEPWFGNSRECENIQVRNISFKKGQKGYSLIIDAHNRRVSGVKVSGVLGHMKFSVENGNGGVFENLTIEDFIIDGTGTSIPEGFAIATNNAIIDNLKVRNGIIKNCSGRGTYCGYGTWNDVIVTNCGLSGFYHNFTALATKHMEASFYDCRAIDNNTTNTANESGWRMYGMNKLNLTNCKATDTRGTKLQKYGVFATTTLVSLINTDLTGNATADYYTGASAATYRDVFNQGSGGSTSIIEARTTDPTSPVVGQIWLRTDL